ncbi:hypothetical protein BGZ63DRAFT_361303 [Mariannaea sp. PMI_226]|nr:hypothetical protein BGZ63DRAFT_361303 [Mariannaea sp. PMI_226]
MPLKILIIGAGVCGPALAILLQRSNPHHSITLLERFPSLRTAGQQIDIKNQGVQILKLMGLLETVRSHTVDETGLEILDSNGKRSAVFGVSPSGQQQFGLTSEYEIMRGDLVKVLYNASLEQNRRLEGEPWMKGQLNYQFGKTITELDQTKDGVDVTFSDGQKERYDLVVAADGQGSYTRRLVFGQEANDAAFCPIGVHAAYYSLPSLEGETRLAKFFNATGRRLVVTRTGGRPKTQVLLFTMQDTEKLSQSYKKPVEEQKDIFAETFRDAGWQTDRLLAGLKTCDDFYTHQLGQIKMKNLHHGRVVLLGDAGYCPSPFTGLGATACLIGAYVLAGELARQGNDVMGALRAYERTMQQPMAEFQRLPTSLLGALFPSSRLGIWMLRNALWAVSKMQQSTNQDSAENVSGWKLPEYPELNLTE